MTRSLREILADSHIAAIAIAVLLLWALDWAFRAVWQPTSQVLGFLFTAVAILDIPYFSRTVTVADRLMLLSTFTYLYAAAISLLSAWLLSRWVYGVGPFRSLIDHSRKLTGRKDA